MKSNWIIVILLMIIAGLIGGGAWVLSKQRTEPAVVASPVEQPRPAVEPARTVMAPAPIAQPAVAERAETVVEMPVAVGTPASPGAAYPMVDKTRQMRRKKAAPVAKAAPPPPVEEPPRIEVYRGHERQVETVKPAKGSDPVTIEMLSGGQRQNVTPPMPTIRKPN